MSVSAAYFGIQGFAFPALAALPPQESDLPMEHSPAKVLRQLIADLAIVAWPIRANKEPDRPDDAVTVFNTSGVDFGRIQFTGERVENYGVQIRVRSMVEEDGYTAAWAIAHALDTEARVVAVEIDGCVYEVQSVSRVNAPLNIGYDTPTSKRSVHTFDALVTLYRRS